MLRRYTRWLATAVVVGLTVLSIGSLTGATVDWTVTFAGR